MDRLQKKYREEVIPKLVERFQYKNPMEVPRLVKIVINMGCGDMSREGKLIEVLEDNLVKIAGQKPVITRARKAISNFKLREGMPVGLKVTLRRQRMYEFMDRLVNLAIPRIRDFRGISAKSFDGRGNFGLSLTEQLIFPEIEYDEVTRVQGMDIAFVTTAKTDEEGQELLRQLGMPFAN